MRGHSLEWRSECWSYSRSVLETTAFLAMSMCFFRRSSNTSDMMLLMHFAKSQDRGFSA